MLRIRRKQMDTLDAIARATFLRRATDEVASWSADRFAGWSRDELARWVEERVDRVLALGLEDEPRVVRWLEIAAAHGDAAEDVSVVHRLQEDDALERWAETRRYVDALLETDPAPVDGPGEEASWASS